MKWLKSRANLLSGLAQAVLSLAVAFGAHLTGQQVGAIAAVVAIVLSLITGMVVNSGTQQ